MKLRKFICRILGHRYKWRPTENFPAIGTRSIKLCRICGKISIQIHIKSWPEEHWPDYANLEVHPE